MEGGRTAFVTGGSGFIGGALIRRLVAEGWTVTGLARSDASSERVRRAGARPAPGDLDDVEAMREAATGSEVAFHAAATVAEWGPPGLYERGNVAGTRKALEACRAAGVARFVHVGTEAALMDGQPLVRADESWPLRPESPVPYCSTKARAEQMVRDANRDGLETVVVRPRLVWGPGDTTILPSLVRSIESGRFSWIGEGRHLTSTTHVDNVVEGLVLAAGRGRPGEAYFVTDGEPIEFREFVTRLVATRGVEPPRRNTPPPLARAAAPLVESIWRTLRRRGVPPVTRLAVWLSSLECTIDISKARSELGYEPVVALDEGLAALAA